MSRSRTRGWFRHEVALAITAFLILVTSAASTHTEAASLPYTVRSWTIEDGLPTSTVQDIAQTPDGYLWLTTTGGLARFDGVRFEIFGLAQGLPTNRFQGMAVDHAGDLWISAVDGNLVRWDGRRFRYQLAGTHWAASGCWSCRTVGSWGPLTTTTGSAPRASLTCLRSRTTR